MKLKDFSKLYFGLLILHLAVIYKPQSQALYLISKPALVFSLLAFFIHRTKGLNKRSKYWVSAALFTSLAGDVLLMNPGDNFFLFGMGAFALAQLAYAGFYFSQPIQFKPGIIAVSALVPLAAGFILYYYVHSPAELRPFLYAYAVLLGVHFILSANFASQVKGFARYAILGAFLFITSDLILAFNKFNGGDKYYQIVVMLTYALAQYFITASLIHYLEPEKSADEVE